MSSNHDFSKHKIHESDAGTYYFRFLIAKNTMILQSLITILFVQNNHCEGIQMVSSLQDQNEAQQVLTLYFALVQLCERSAEPIQDYLQ